MEKNVINSIFEELANNPSRNFKIDLLKQHKDNELLKRVIFLALDPYTQFYIRKIPEYQQTEEIIGLDAILDNLVMLSDRQVTGNAAIKLLKSMLSHVSEDDAKVLKRIIQKDLKCGVSEATVNAVWPGLIPTFDVCLAHKDISNIKFPAIAQTKMDGASCHVIRNGSKVDVFSRNGKLFDLKNTFDSSAMQLLLSYERWDGELVFFENGKPLDRKTSNGLANKALKGTISEQEAQKAVFIVWDITDTTSTIPYETRWKTLCERIKHFDGNFKLCNTEIVNSQEEAYMFYEKMIVQGEEGAILKNMDFKWEPKRVKSVGKMKAEEDVTLEVIDKVEGTGRNVGRLGALICQTKDGNVKVNVGSGFSDEDRVFFWNVPPKFIDVVYNQVITDKKTNQKSLFLPRFLKERTDKTQADMLM